MTRPVFEEGYSKEDARLGYRTSQLERRPMPEGAGGVAIFEIKVDEDTVVVTARDGAFKFDIPSDLDGAVLIDCEAWITEVSSSGDVVVQLRNATQGLNMLSTPLKIDVGEKNDDDSGTPFVINTANDDVAYKDEIWINVTNAGSGALGLGVAVKFAPAENAAIGIVGEQGPPGGVTDFTGAWQDVTGYSAGDVVTHNGVLYIALQDHTSAAANDEPGVGTNWEDFWAPAFDLPLGGTINCNVAELSGSAISDGVKGVFRVPADMTITSAMVLANQAGDIEVDVWRTDFGGYPPDVSDSITGSSPLTLTGSIKNLDATLTGWTTALLEGDLLAFVVSGASLIQRVTAILTTEKN